MYYLKNFTLSVLLREGVEHCTVSSLLIVGWNVW